MQKKDMQITEIVIQKLFSCLLLKFFSIGTRGPRYINDLQDMHVILDFDALPANKSSSHVREGEGDSLLQFNISEVAMRMFSDKGYTNFLISMSRRRTLQTLNAVRATILADKIY